MNETELREGVRKWLQTHSFDPFALFCETELIQADPSLKNDQPVVVQALISGTYSYGFSNGKAGVKANYTGKSPVLAEVFDHAHAAGRKEAVRKP